MITHSFILFLLIIWKEASEENKDLFSRPGIAAIWSRVTTKHRNGRKRDWRDVDSASETADILFSFHAQQFVVIIKYLSNIALPLCSGPSKSNWLYCVHYIILSEWLHPLCWAQSWPSDLHIIESVYVSPPRRDMSQWRLSRNRANTNVCRYS